MPETSLRSQTGRPILDLQQVDAMINDKTICKGLNLQVSAGQTWAILGMNGAGKTTLMHTIAGLRQAAAGNILLNGKPIQEQGRRDIARQLGILLQINNDTFPATVLETALTGRHPYLQSWQWESHHDIKMAEQALSQVDLQGMEPRLINTLSGGEKRRLHLASLLTQDPQLYLLDEPVNHLDMHHQVSILDLFQSLTRTGNKACIMIMHDLNLVQRYCDYCLLLLPDGETITGPTGEVFNTQTLSRMLNHPTRRIETPGGPVYLPD